ncbi:ABC transporter permease [Haladaptatus sp. R4]|uniref:ABC transporter permease n=1 Tax=Haladaptatus sp. R4 TaxID=1679489 RepID=UPI001CBD45E2|nr:ABC transporter permease [Haladaptatus sp. R4]
MKPTNPDDHDHTNDMTTHDLSELVPDGGSKSIQSPLEISSETTVTRSERYSEFFDTHVIAPLRIAYGDFRTRLGLIIISLYVLMGTVGVVLIPAPKTYAHPSLIKPFQNIAYPLGTDNSGQGILAQIIHATPPMIEMIISGAIFATAVAVLVGTISGYKGGRTDRILMLITDIMMTIPGLPLVIVIGVILQPKDPWVVGLVLTINAWAGLARNIRSQVLTLREESYIEASRVIGMSSPRIIREDVLPNLMSYISINFVRSARNVIFGSVGLYFLGVLPFSNLNWGVMMNLAYTSGGALSSLDTAYWLIEPMLAIILLTFGLVLFSQGLDRVFNPRIRARHSQTVGGDEESEEIH